MHHIITTASILVLGAHFVEAVALSDFRPSTVGLASTCNQVYQSQIIGCQRSDFNTSNGCSSGCIQGLLQKNTDIAIACQNANVASNSIIGIFLAGKGLRALCNIEVVTKTLGNTPTAAPVPVTTAKPTTAPSPSPLQTSSTSVFSSSTLSTSLQSTTSMIQSSSPANSIMTIPLSSASSASMLTSMSTATAAGQSIVPSLLPKCTNPGNGQGGSPFDQVPGKECVNSGISLRASLSFGLGCAVVALML